MRTYLEVCSGEPATLNERFANRSNWRGMTVEADPERFGRLRKWERNAYVQASCVHGSNEPHERAGVSRVALRELLDHPIFVDPHTGRRRLGLLKLGAQSRPISALSEILGLVRPTNIEMSTSSMSDDEAVGVDALLGLHGYEHRGRRGGNMRYARRSVLLVANMKWSTGSIARDLASIDGSWDVDCLGWDVYPQDLESMLAEYDAVASFLLHTPVVWPPLRRGGVFCCGPVEIDWAKRGAPSSESAAARVPFGFHGRCIGAVSRQIHGMLMREEHAKRVLYTPASARRSRFHRGGLRGIRTLGWVGVPNSERNFGMDAKRFGMFQEIAARTGLQVRVSHQAYTYDTMQEFYDGIDLLVCTSMSEGGPLGPFEAIACGVPAISTDVGLVRETRSIPKFVDVDGAVDLIDRMRRDRAMVASLRDRQYGEFEHRLSMERLLPHWERFFEACRIDNGFEWATESPAA